MCAINRISSQPPLHPECADFSARSCPFLINSRMRRREDNLPDKQEPTGLMLEHNPGVTLVWLTRRFKVLHELNGYLFEIGTPTKTLWYKEVAVRCEKRLKPPSKPDFPYYANMRRPRRIWSSWRPNASRP